ncbi:MAG: hypothetical protein ABSG73_00365 [Candidatus Aminicenantales bacterium]
MSEIQRRIFKRAAATGQRSPLPKGEAGPFPGHPSVQMDDARFIAGTMTRTKWSEVEYYGPGAAAAEERRRQALGLGPVPLEGSQAAHAEAVIAANTTPEAKQGWLRRQLNRLGRRR